MHPTSVISFGPFTLSTGERLLTKDGAPVELGARAFDILATLVSRPSELIGKQELMARVWPDVTVEEANLRVQMVLLRKALGDGTDGVRYITTIAGRGYCFVAPISIQPSNADEGPRAVAAFPGTNLPVPPTRMLGRAESVQAISDTLQSTRFVTIVGTGGVGKTTIAVAIAHELIETFAGDVVFADLGTVGDPSHLASSLASTLGLSVRSDDCSPALVAYFRDRRTLVVLDSCEHLIDAAAALVERLFVTAPQIHILATSREPLKVQQEHVYRLMPLAFPAEELDLAAENVLAFPAVQLFLERAGIDSTRQELSNSDAGIVAKICRRLDGVALSIELAAARVEAYGLHQTAALLEHRLSLLWQGLHDGPPRQRTLQATLDWSYGLLSDVERTVLCRLSIFVGPFLLDAARIVVMDEFVDETAVLNSIEGLVAKSIVATTVQGTATYHRLLDMTRTYAAAQLSQAERSAVAARHAIYCYDWLLRTEAEWPAEFGAAERSSYLAHLNNVRAALEWCFGTQGDATMSVRLAAAAASGFLATSQFMDCCRWSKRALRAIGADSRAEAEELSLQAALGLGLMYTQGNTDAARTALERGVEIAEKNGDASRHLLLVGQLFSFHLRLGDFKTTLRYAQRSGALAGAVSDPSAIAMAHSVLGTSLHFLGDLGSARRELEMALQLGGAPQPFLSAKLTLDLRNWSDWSSLTLARTVWLLGYPARAVDLALRTVEQNARVGHPVRLSVALTWATSVLLWTGDLPSAEKHVDRLIALAELNSLGPYLLVGRGYEGEIALRRGDTDRGIESLQNCLEGCRAANYGVLTTAFRLSLAQGFAASGRLAESLALLDDTIARIELQGDLIYMPELLRLKGGMLLSGAQSSPAESEVCLAQSIEWSRRQGAVAWELRAAVDLASIWAGQGQADRAAGLLQQVRDKFEEGYATSDLQAADHLLETLA